MWPLLWWEIKPDINPGDWVHQHAARDRCDGDRRLEADGRVPPPPHSGGFQGPRQPTNTSDGTAEKETKIESDQTLNQSRCDRTLTLAIWCEIPVNVIWFAAPGWNASGQKSSEKFYSKYQEQKIKSVAGLYESIFDDYYWSWKPFTILTHWNLICKFKKWYPFKLLMVFKI